MRDCSSGYSGMKRRCRRSTTSCYLPGRWKKSSVPTPPMLAVFDDGQPIAGLTGLEFESRAECYEALFVKPVRSSGCNDSILWERVPSGAWRCTNSSRISPRFHAGI